MSPPLKTGSLRKVYPKEIKHRKSIIRVWLEKNTLKKSRDTLKRIISFNSGSALISKNLNTNVEKVDNELGLEYYTLCESNLLGEPVINISYDP